VCQAYSVIPKKTQASNCCQRCFNKALSKGSEYLCKCDIFINLQKCFLKVFALSLWVLCID
jgi:hypothetical protein